jgi:hypothetical protein
MKLVLKCLICSERLSLPIEIIDKEDARFADRPEIDGEPRCLQGFAIVEERERIPPFGHLYPPSKRTETVYCLNPDDILYGQTVVQLADRMQGCCGPTGALGPNAACGCGAEIGTESSDCWMSHEFIPLSGATEWD